MAKFSASLSMLWPELPFLDRFAAAAAAGFSGIEILFPYDTDARQIQRLIQRCGLHLVVINAPPPNYTGGARGFAARPGGSGRFQHDMRRVFRYASALGAQNVHVMSGDGSGEEALDTMIENLKWSSRAAPKGLNLTISPLNAKDFPGYFMNDYGLAAQVLDAVKRPNVRLQYNSYHAHVIHGDAVEIWRRYGLRAAHAQIADAPGRAQPGRGKIDFPALMQAMEETEYKGWVGAEYTPHTKTTEEGLRWLRKLGSG